MDWMQFIVALLDKLAWPAVAAFVVFTVRAPLSRLIPLARRLKFRELEVEFGEGLKQVAKKAEGAFPELKRDKKARLIASAANLPNSAVLESWKVVDQAAEQLLRASHPNVNLPATTRYKFIEELLIDGELIDVKKAKLFNELRQLRNKVAHAVGFEVGKAEAIQYIELCFKLAEHFHALTTEQVSH